VKVLIVDADPVSSAALHEYLMGLGHQASHVAEGRTALGMTIADHWDAVLLDLSLPGLDGLTLCRTLRHERRYGRPIMLLSARASLEDKLAGFAAGADDYVVKPYALSEVAARLAAISKRVQRRRAPNVLHFEDIVMDQASMSVKRGGRPVKLSAKCYGVLKVLMETPDRVCAQVDLEHAVWGGLLKDTCTLRTHLHALRRALMVHGGCDPIETVHGLGYRLALPSVDARGSLTELSPLAEVSP
jgi:DNA-binding response OmpR family regulator